MTKKKKTLRKPPVALEETGASMSQEPDGLDEFVELARAESALQLDPVEVIHRSLDD